MAYFRLKPNPHIRALLGDAGGEALYGRCNVIRSPEGELLAEIIEILPHHGGGGAA